MFRAFYVALTVAGYWGAPAKPPELMSETKPRRSALEPLSAGGNDSGGSVSVGGTIGTLRGRFGESCLAHSDLVVQLKPWWFLPRVRLT